jgi:hypothetical protein
MLRPNAAYLDTNAAVVDEITTLAAELQLFAEPDMLLRSDQALENLKINVYDRAGSAESKKAELTQDQGIQLTFAIQRLRELRTNNAIANSDDLEPGNDWPKDQCDVVQYMGTYYDGSEFSDVSNRFMRTQVNAYETIAVSISRVTHIGSLSTSQCIELQHDNGISRDIVKLGDYQSLTTGEPHVYLKHTVERSQLQNATAVLDSAFYSDQGVIDLMQSALLFVTNPRTADRQAAALEQLVDNPRQADRLWHLIEGVRADVYSVATISRTKSQATSSELPSSQRLLEFSMLLRDIRDAKHID